MNPTQTSATNLTATRPVPPPLHVPLRAAGFLLAPLYAAGDFAV